MKKVNFLPIRGRTIFSRNGTACLTLLMPNLVMPNVPILIVHMVFKLNGVNSLKTTSSPRDEFNVMTLEDLRNTAAQRHNRNDPGLLD